MAPRAEAHAVLLRSDPAPGDVVPPGRRELELHYNSRIDQARSRLTLTQPDGKIATLPIAPESGVDALQAETDLVPGAYTIYWQVLALDGHMTCGTVPFEVKADAAAVRRTARDATIRAALKDWYVGLIRDEHVPSAISRGRHVSRWASAGCQCRRSAVASSRTL